MRRSRSRHQWIVACLAACLAVAGCQRETAPSPPQTVAPEPAPTSSSATPSSPTPTGPTAPLTGAPVSGDLPNRPALAVKIDNVGEARTHQYGIGVADLVFEQVVEAEATRFAAVFHSTGSEQVGPIRSGRTQDVDLLTSLRRPLFAYSGANPTTTSMIAGSSLVDLNAAGRGKGYYRGTGKSPHNLYNSTARLWEQAPADDPGAPPAQFSYLPAGTQVTGQPASTVDVRMASVRVRWRWDAAAHGYRRTQNGTAHRDVLNGPVTATNVIVMGVAYQPSVADVRSPEAQTLGSGPVQVFTDGQVRSGRWQRASAEEPPQLLATDGSTIALRPGNTWIELAPGGEAPQVTVTP